MLEFSQSDFGGAGCPRHDRDCCVLDTARRAVRAPHCSRLGDMRMTARVRMVPETDRRFFQRRRDVHSKARQFLVDSVADELRFIGDSAGVQTFLQGPLKVRIHRKGDQLLIWRPFIRHGFIKSIRIHL